MDVVIGPPDLRGPIFNSVIIAAIPTLHCGHSEDHHKSAQSLRDVRQIEQIGTSTLRLDRSPDRTHITVSNEGAYVSGTTERPTPRPSLTIITPWSK